MPDHRYSKTRHIHCRHERSQNSAGNDPAPDASSESFPNLKFSLTLKSLFLLPIWFYKKAISPWLPPCCKYTPTCSAYAAEAILKHGVLKGIVLAVWRILRCNPFSKGGYDPVPEPRNKKKK